jgi:hypothetical protein
MSSVAKYRTKRKQAGLVRTEVYVPVEDVALVRDFAERRRRRAAALAELAELVERHRLDAFWSATADISTEAGRDVALRRLAKYAGLDTARRIGHLKDALESAREWPTATDRVAASECEVSESGTSAEIDDALNKCLALASRWEPRDVWDVVDLVARGHNLGGLVWAAPAKDPGYSAELLLDHMTWHSRVDPERLRDELSLPEPPDPVAIKRAYLEAVRAAHESFARSDLKRMGELPLAPDGTKVLAPDDKSAVWHVGSLRGCWPEVTPLP